MLKNRCLFPGIFLYFFVLLLWQCTSEKSVLQLALRQAGPEVQVLLKQKEKHEIQIRLTEVTAQNEQLFFKTSTFQEDDHEYFYPASTTKLPVAILALQKLRTLQKQGIAIDASTSFLIHDREGNPIAILDSTAQNHKISVAHLIKKIFLVSDNDAYNYLFDFLGRDYINQELQKIGITHTHIYHKFMMDADNVNTWEYTFFNQDGDTLYFQSSIQSIEQKDNAALKSVFKGIGHLSDGELIKEPMDFSQKNSVSISDLEGILKRIIYPNSYPEQERFSIIEEDLEFLRFWMGRNTLESTTPDYHHGEYYDSYVKFFIYGDTKGKMTEDIRIYNKVGLAHGTLTDVAFIHDKQNDIRFFLTATVLVNKNQIFNDDTYEYDEEGIPFLAELGRSVLSVLQTQR